MSGNNIFFDWTKSLVLCLLGVLVIGAFSWLVSGKPISNQENWYIGQILCGGFIIGGCVLFLMGFIGILSHLKKWSSETSNTQFRRASCIKTILEKTQ